MPDDYFETVQLLERELCDTHISSLFGCSHFTAANQIILECLMERVKCKADILDLCEALSLLKNTPKLTEILDNLRMGKEVQYGKFFCSYMHAFCCFKYVHGCSLCYMLLDFQGLLQLHALFTFLTVKF